MVDFEKDWEKIMKIINDTKDLDLDSVLILPMEDWNPAILTEKRKEILAALKKKKFKSEGDMAKFLKRKRPNVVSDLKFLEHYGLIELVKDSRRTRPVLKKSEIILY